MTDGFDVPNAHAGNGAPRPHCLVVDGEPHLRRALIRVLQQDGYSCDEAANGAEALEILARQPAALVLTALHMPVLDGAGLLRHVRERHPDTAVMLVTPVTDIRTAVACLGEGAMDYLTTPFHVDEVRARVRAALERRSLMLENREYRGQLEERVAARTSRLEQLILASFQSLADALEEKDVYTRGHSQRVSRYSSLIARELGLGEGLIRQVELGCRVQDIGKVGVQETVLNKPGPLSDGEYRHIMTHPMVGWHILSPLLTELPHALNVVRHHHERWDGRGLPDGLSGTAIPIEARIAAAADTFDAMTSERPYRPGAPLDATLAELRRCANAQFDPAVVDALLALVSRGETGVERFESSVSPAAA